MSAGKGASSDIFETIHRDIVLGSVLSLRILGWLDFTARSITSSNSHNVLLAPAGPHITAVLSITSKHGSAEDIERGGPEKATDSSEVTEQAD